MKTLLTTIFILLSNLIFSQYITELSATQNGVNQIKVHLKAGGGTYGEYLSYTVNNNQNIVTLSVCYFMTDLGSTSFFDNNFYIDLPNNNYTLNVDLYRSINNQVCDHTEKTDSGTLNLTTPIEGVISLSTADLQSQSEKPKVFPNPAKNVLNINTPNKIDKITIFDSAGKLVFTVHKPGDKIDVAKLTNGVYFLEIMSNKKKWREKIIIKK